MSEHDQLVKNVIDNLIRAGFTDIKADFEGWNKPEGIHWTSNPNINYIPDIVATKYENVEIFEIETASSINLSHTEEQIKLFYTYAENNKAKFQLVVPKAIANDAINLVNKLGLNISIMVAQ